MRHILTSHLYDIAYLGLFIFGSYLDLTESRSLAILQSSFRMTLWAILYIICLCLFPYIISCLYQTNIPFTFAVLQGIKVVPRNAYCRMHVYSISLYHLGYLGYYNTFNLLHVVKVTMVVVEYRIIYRTIGI